MKTPKLLCSISLTYCFSFGHMTSEKTNVENISKNEDGNSEKEEETYSGLVNTWAENCDCNGVPNIQRSTHYLRKTIWIILVLTGAGRCYFTVTNDIPFLSDFLDYSYGVTKELDLTEWQNTCLC